MSLAHSRTRPSAPPLECRSLYYADGNSDKEYHAQLIRADSNGYLVAYQYGRRGRPLITGLKTPEPVSLMTAQRLYDRLIQSKLRKGYKAGMTIIP